MSRFTTIAATAALGLSGAACTFAPETLRPETNTSLYSLHQPVVQRTDYVLDLPVGPNGLPATERARLDAWFRSIELGYGDRISVDEPRGYDYPAAKVDIAAVAGDYGLLISEGAPITAGEVRPGSVRVVASRATASVPGCPVWFDPIAATTATSANFGCATNSNIAAMVANPSDLVLGQSGSVERSATTATRAIRSYREAPPTGRQGLNETQTSKE